MYLIAEPKKLIYNDNNYECIDYENKVEFNNINANKIIRHIVIAGGGTMGFSYYGILKEAHMNKLWSISNIRTIYGTSVGSIIGTIIALNYEWKTIDDYFINRPWEKVFNYDMNTLILSIRNQGVFGRKIIEDIFTPLLLGKNILPSITLLDFYNETNIDLHIMVTNVNEFKPVDLSHQTHPSWNLIDAIYASCSVPVIFQPVHYGNITYCDGGIFSNYPINECIANGAMPCEIIGINGINNKNENNIESNMSEYSLIDYIIFLIGKLFQMLFIVKYIDIGHYFVVNIDMNCLDNITEVAESKKERARLIKMGVDVFLEQYSSKNE